MIDKQISLLESKYHWFYALSRQENWKTDGKEWLKVTIFSHLTLGNHLRFLVDCGGLHMLCK